MADLRINSCDVSINSGGMSAPLEAELEKLFPQKNRSGKCQLGFSYDLNVETLYIDIDYRQEYAAHENLMMISVDGLNEIDALRRYCEMVLEHHKQCQEQEHLLSATPAHQEGE